VCKDWSKILNCLWKNIKKTAGPQGGFFDSHCSYDKQIARPLHRQGFSAAAAAEITQSMIYNLTVSVR